MASEKTKLLNKAVKDFTDKKSACICYSAYNIQADNGFNYILIDKAKSKIINNIAVHTNKNREMLQAGQMDTGEFIFQSPVALSDMFKEKPALYILEYEKHFFTVHSLIAYNKDMNNFDYRAEILQNKNKQFIIYDITEIKDNLLNNSIPLWIYNKDRLNIPIYPAYLSPLNLETPYLSVEILETKGLSIANLKKDKDNSYIHQWKQDTVNLYLMNASSEIQQRLAYDIQTLALNNNNNVFGINDFINFKSISDDRQRGFGIVSNKAVSSFKINYYQETITNYKAIEIIKKIIVQVNNKEITLFNIENKIQEDV